MPEIQIKKIYRSRRRTMALEITPSAELIVRVPYRIPEYKVIDFVNSKKVWILTKQKLVGERMRKREEKKILLEHPIAWYRAQAQKIIKERSEYFARVMDLKYAAIKINSAKKRWGSCSAKNSLNFTWRLVLAPPNIIDYVVVHELSHIEVKNHSARFWHKVKTFCPDYLAARRWLKENSGHLVY